MLLRTHQKAQGSERNGALARGAQHGSIVAIIVTFVMAGAAAARSTTATTRRTAITLASRHSRSSGFHLALVGLAALPLRPAAFAGHVAAARHQRLAGSYREGVMRAISATIASIAAAAGNVGL